MNNHDQIGIIREQGDMGLGFDPINPEEQKTLEEHGFYKNSDSDKVIHETKKNDK